MNDFDFAEDAYLDQYWEDRISGPDYSDWDGELDNGYDYGDELEDWEW